MHPHCEMEGLLIISSEMGAAWLGLHHTVCKLVKQSDQQWPEWERQPCSAHVDGLVGVQGAGGFPAPSSTMWYRCPTSLRCFGRFHQHLHCFPWHVVPAIWDRKKHNERVIRSRRWLEIFSLLCYCLCICLASSGFHPKKHSSWYLTGVRSLSWCWLKFLEAWRKVSLSLVEMGKEEKNTLLEAPAYCYISAIDCCCTLITDSAGNIIYPVQFYIRLSCLLHREKAANMFSAVRWMYQNYES